MYVWQPVKKPPTYESVKDDFLATTRHKRFVKSDAWSPLFQRLATTKRDPLPHADIFAPVYGEHYFEFEFVIEPEDQCHLLLDRLVRHIESVEHRLYDYMMAADVVSLTRTKPMLNAILQVLKNFAYEYIPEEMSNYLGACNLKYRTAHPAIVRQECCFFCGDLFRVIEYLQGELHDFHPLVHITLFNISSRCVGVINHFLEVTKGAIPVFDY